jgi:hypothetical protein
VIGIVTSPAVKLSPNARNRVRDSVGAGVGVGVGPVGLLPPQADSQRHTANRTMVPRRVKRLYFSAALADSSRFHGTLRISLLELPGSSLSTAIGAEVAFDSTMRMET